MPQYEGRAETLKALGKADVERQTALSLLDECIVLANDISFGASRVHTRIAPTPNGEDDAICKEPNHYSIMDKLRVLHNILLDARATVNATREELGGDD